MKLGGQSPPGPILVGVYLSLYIESFHPHLFSGVAIGYCNCNWRFG